MTNYLEEKAKLNNYLLAVKKAVTDKQLLEAAYILLLSFKCFDENKPLQADIIKYIKSVERHSKLVKDWKQTDIEELIRQIEDGRI